MKNSKSFSFKKTVKRMLAAILVLATVLSLCACGGSSSNLFKAVDTLGRMKNADTLCNQFKGSVVRENMVDYSSYLRTTFIVPQYKGFSFTEIKVDCAKADHSLIRVQLSAKQDELRNDVEKMIKDGTLFQTANGSYTYMPEDEAYTLTLTETYEIVLLERVPYYILTIAW